MTANLIGTWDGTLLADNQTRQHTLCRQAGIFSDREQNLGLID